MKNMLFLIIAATLLTACSAIRDRSESANLYQSECEKQHPEFVDMVSCLDKKITSNQFLSNQPKPKLYLLTAKDLASKVSSGAISETQARLQLQTRYVEIGQIRFPRTVQQ